MATVDLADVTDIAQVAQLLSSGESYIVRNSGEHVGLLISTKDSQLLEAIEDYLDNQAADAALAEPGEPIPYEQLRKELGLALTTD